MLQRVPPLRGLKESRRVSHRFTMSYDMASLRDWQKE